MMLEPGGGGVVGTGCRHVSGGPRQCRHEACDDVRVWHTVVLNAISRILNKFQHCHHQNNSVCGACCAWWCKRQKSVKGWREVREQLSIAQRLRVKYRLCKMGRKRRKWLGK